MAVVHLADYRPPPYLPPPYRLERTDLTVRLFADHALVEARLAFLRGPGAEGPLELRGVDLELRSLHLDGVPLPAEAFQLEDDRLLLLHHRNDPS